MKPYVKPDLYYENFEMSQHIASCDWDMPNSKNIEECAALGDSTTGALSGIWIFTDSVAQCEFKQDDIDAYCYTNGSEEFKIFNS